MTLKQHDWITHPTYGSGQIQEPTEKKYIIRFLDAGTKDIIIGFSLVTCEPPTPDFKFPSPLKPAKGAHNPKSKKLTAAFTFAHMLEKFVAEFPKGFDDPEYLTGQRSERDYKVRAASRFASELNDKAFQKRLDENQFAEIPMLCSGCSKAIPSSRNAPGRF